jgi:hypothetical protein
LALLQESAVSLEAYLLSAVSLEAYLLSAVSLEAYLLSAVSLEAYLLSAVSLEAYLLSVEAQGAALRQRHLRMLRLPEWPALVMLLVWHWECPLCWSWGACTDLPRLPSHLATPLIRQPTISTSPISSY